MEAFYYILFGAVCFISGSVISYYYTKEKTRLEIKSKFHKHFKEFKAIGKPKFDNLI